jgi:hypothetical protein
MTEKSNYDIKKYYFPLKYYRKEPSSGVLNPSESFPSILPHPCLMDPCVADKCGKDKQGSKGQPYSTIPCYCISACGNLRETEDDDESCPKYILHVLTVDPPSTLECNVSLAPIARLSVLIRIGPFRLLYGSNQVAGIAVDRVRLHWIVST